MDTKQYSESAINSRLNALEDRIKETDKDLSTRFCHSCGSWYPFSKHGCRRWKCGHCGGIYCASCCIPRKMLFWYHYNKFLCPRVDCKFKGGEELSSVHPHNASSEQVVHRPTVPLRPDA